MYETRKKGRPCKRWKYEFEKDLNIIGIKIKQAMARDCQEWRKTIGSHIPQWTLVLEKNKKEPTKAPKSIGCHIPQWTLVHEKNKKEPTKAPKS